MFFAEYSYVHALIGGALIGLGSWMAAMSSGKIPGISGVFSRILGRWDGDAVWRVVFLVGLMVGAVLAFAVTETAANYRPVRSLLVVGVAGLLVGFGTRLGGGCTSGHGVCGLGLGSKTALAATVLFMFAGMITVFLVQRFAPGFAP